MSTIYELKTALNTLLGSSYYSDEAPEAAAYPYRVGTITTSYDDEISENFVFELDYWDEGKSTEGIDALIEEDSGDGNLINPTGINKRRVDLNNGYAVINKDNTITVNDPDRNIRHKRVSYMIRLYYS